MSSLVRKTKCLLNISTDKNVFISLKISVKTRAEKEAIDVLKVKLQIPDYSPRNLVKCGSNNLPLVFTDQVERNWS